MSETDLQNVTSPARRPAPAIVRVIDRISDIASYGAAAALLLLALNVFVDVIGRTLFNAPFTGTLEMTANWWMPTLTLLAFAFTERLQEHIKVTILLDALPLRMRQIVEGMFGILATGLLVALAYYTLQDALKAEHIRQTTAGAPPVAIWPFKFVAVAGIVLLSLQTAASTFRYFAGHLPYREDYRSDADLG